MLRAAFTSRSCTVPQSHVHSRTFNGSFSRTVPQAPHSLLEGNQRSITTRSRPYQAHQVRISPLSHHDFPRALVREVRAELSAWALQVANAGSLRGGCSGYGCVLSEYGGSSVSSPAGGYQVDPDTVFRASVEFLDTKDFVYGIAAGTAGDLGTSAGMAGDDTTAHSFASKYEPAARTIVKAIGTAGQGMATISSRLLAMATNYLAAEDSVAASMTGKVDTSSGLSPSAAQQQCEPSEAYGSLPMVTGSKQVHEIPVIGKFWPQGDPDRLRGRAGCGRRVPPWSMTRSATPPVTRRTSGSSVRGRHSTPSTRMPPPCTRGIRRGAPRHRPRCR